MTKSAQIRALWDGVRTAQEIAGLVGCREEYVRTVIQRAKGGGLSVADKNYKRRNAEALKAKAYAYQSTAWATGDRDKALAEGRRAYRAMRDRGASIREAQIAKSTASQTVIRATCDHEASAKAGREAYWAIKERKTCGG